MINADQNTATLATHVGLDPGKDITLGDNPPDDLQEAGLIKAGPQKILAQGTDWRFVDELKKQLKG